MATKRSENTPEPLTVEEVDEIEREFKIDGEIHSIAENLIADWRRLTQSNTALADALEKFSTGWDRWLTATAAPPIGRGSKIVALHIMREARDEARKALRDAGRE